MGRKKKRILALRKDQIPRTAYDRAQERSIRKGAIRPTRVAVKLKNGRWSEILTLDPNPSRLHGPVRHYREIVQTSKPSKATEGTPQPSGPEARRATAQTYQGGPVHGTAHVNPTLASSRRTAD